MFISLYIFPSEYTRKYVKLIAKYVSPKSWSISLHQRIIHIFAGHLFHGLSCIPMPWQILSFSHWTQCPWKQAETLIWTQLIVLVPKEHFCNNVHINDVPQIWNKKIFGPFIYFCKAVQQIEQWRIRFTTVWDHCCYIILFRKNTHIL